MFHYSNKEVNDIGKKAANEKEKLEIPTVTVKEVCSKDGKFFFQILINNQKSKKIKKLEVVNIFVKMVNIKSPEVNCNSVSGTCKN